MEKQIQFNSPLGEEIINPSLEFLREVIFEYKADYWSKESTGDAALVIRKNNRELWFIFFYDEPYGFFIYYDTEFVSVQKGIPLKDDRYVEHVVGTEPMRVPTICYRTREEAWAILMDFINYQKMSDQYNWVRLGEIDYKREPM